MGGVESRLSLLTVFGNGQLYGVAWSLIFVKYVFSLQARASPTAYGS